jgi:3-isopropylmalate/(R)-2-methylmalate dehydratase large subunit
MRATGRAVVLGDDIDTDTIFPGRYLAVLKPEDQARHLFEPLGEALRQRVVDGGVIVAGWNFGCGSSREHAVTAMIGAGVRLVVARSFSRIFYRNAVNNGLAVIVDPAMVDIARDDSVVLADLGQGRAAVDDTALRFTPLPADVLRILAAGGLWAAMAPAAQGASAPIDAARSVPAPDSAETGAQASGPQATDPQASGPQASGPQTLVEKIFGRLAGRPVRAGELVDIAPDWTFALDDGIGLIDQNFKRYGVDRLAHPEKIALFFDHYAPADTPLHAHVQRVGRRLFERFGLPRERLFEVGEGISHQVAVERGFVRPGHLVTNMDSHTLTIGAIGAIGCGIGGAEMAYLWAHGRLWFRVPQSLRIDLAGRLPAGTSAKDLVLSILRRLTARGAIYGSIEYHGEALAHLSIAERMTLCNMGIEMGAKFAVVPGDAVTRAHFGARGTDVGEMPVPDPGASYAETHRFDLAEVEPFVSAPGRVDDVHPVSVHAGQRIDQAFIGTCTNGRLDDLRQAAQVLAGRRIAPHVRLVVTPASREVYRQAIEQGVLQVLMDAGATVTTPGCGACAGMHQGVLAEDEVCISSSSRNFLGRMGHRDARVFLGSPATVAASALIGAIADPRNVGECASSG